MSDRQCTATAKSTGQRCKRRPIPGGNVCVKHGGAAPQVQRKAAERLAELRDAAAGLFALQIRKTVEHIEADKPPQPGDVEPSLAIQATKQLSELVETMEGRVARREGVEVHEFADLSDEELDARIAALERGEAPPAGKAVPVESAPSEPAPTGIPEA